MGWPESVTYLLLLILGYALTRIVDLAMDWQRNKLRLAGGAPPPAPEATLSATARQRLLERRAVYARFRKSVNDAVGNAVNQGHGSYGLLYQIRDDYGDLLRQAPTTVSHAADSVIRCVTLLVNLGPSDQRYAMFTRALNLFDEECGDDQGLRAAPAVPRRQEISVIGNPGADDGETDGVSPPPEVDSPSIRPRA